MRPYSTDLRIRVVQAFHLVCATSAVCTSLRCCGPARATGVARGVRGCGRAGGRRRSPIAGGSSWRERGAGRRQRVGARAKGLYFSYIRSATGVPWGNGLGKGDGGRLAGAIANGMAHAQQG
jgi:hypothetical protein